MAKENKRALADREFLQRLTSMKESDGDSSSFSSAYNVHRQNYVRSYPLSFEQEETTSKKQNVGQKLKNKFINLFKGKK